MIQAPRVWDWDKIMSNGDFKRTDKVLETGAMFGLICKVCSPFVESIVVTDSYGWSKRGFTQGEEDVVGIWEKDVKSLPNAILQQADMQSLPYYNDSFDKVISVSAIEHVDDDRKAMEEMMRVLKPGGLLLLTTEYGLPNKVVDIDGSFYRVYDDKRIDGLTKGFKVIKRETANNTIFLALQK